MTFHLNQFDGPLDLLLYLIGKAQIDIKDIFVSDITEQYIESIRMADDLNMDEASDFINMAATLIEIKSRSLLPKQELSNEEEDPEKLLIQQLEMYQRMKETAADLRAFEKSAAELFSKLPEEYPLPPVTFELTGLTKEGLLNALKNVLERKAYREEIENTPINNRIIRDPFDVPGSMKQIRKLLKRGTVSFSRLLSDAPSKHEIVTVFLAILELIRLGSVTVIQEEIYKDILLVPVNHMSEQELEEP